MNLWLQIMSSNKGFNSNILTFMTLLNCFRNVKFRTIKSSVSASLYSNSLIISKQKHDKKQEQNLVTIC